MSQKKIVRVPVYPVSISDKAACVYSWRGVFFVNMLHPHVAGIDPAEIPEDAGSVEQLFLYLKKLQFNKASGHSECQEVPRSDVM